MTCSCDHDELEDVDEDGPDHQAEIEVVVGDADGFIFFWPYFVFIATPDFALFGVFEVFSWVYSVIAQRPGKGS